MSAMSEPDYTEQPLDEYEVMDMLRLEELKGQKAAIEDEIAYLTEWAAKRITKETTYATGDRTIIAHIVRSSKTTVDIPTLQVVNPDLVAEITKPAVDTALLAKAKDLGFFAEGRPETQAISITYSKPYVKFTTKKETNSA